MLRLNLSSKIAILTAVLLLGLGTVMLITFGILSVRQTDRTIGTDSRLATRQLELFLSVQSSDLARQCRMAAQGDARTRGLIFLGDQVTAQNDMDRLAEQYAVYAVQVVNAEGKVLGQSKTLSDLGPVLAQHLQAKVSQALSDNRGKTAIIYADSHICLVSCVPVRSGTFVKGALCLLNQLGPEQANGLARRMGDEFSLIANGKIVASSLDTPYSLPARFGLPTEVRVNGERYISISEPLIYSDPADHLGFVVLRSTRAILEPYTEARNAFVSVLAVALVLSIACGIGFGRNVAEPLSSLAESARIVQAGAWPKPFDVQRKDEIGILQSSFNDMVNASRKAQSEAILANKVKKEFLTNMSHELRTPMNGILGVSSMLRDKLKDPNTVKLLDLVILSSERLHGVLADILTMSALESESLEVKHETFSPDDLILAVVDLYRSEAFKKGIAITMSNPESPRPMVIGDAIRLKQLFGHLIGNAIKFTNKGSVSLQWSYAISDDTVRLTWSVTDTGVGIPDGIQEKLFEAFTQLDSSLTRSFEGVGLGLTIVQRIISLMGGEIDLKSKVNQGTTVSISIPFQTPSV